MRTHRSSVRSIVVVAFLVATAAASAACGSDDEGGDTTGDGGTEPASGTTVDVTLQEFAVGASPAEAPAGSVTFEVTNVGPEDVHEFVVIRTDVDPTALPTDDNGVVDEEGEGLELIDEIEDIPVDESQSITLDLEAGNYVLICNIWDEDEQEAHYVEGMRTAFTVG